MSFYVRDGGTWKIPEVYVRDGGVWKQPEVYVRDGGVWKLVHAPLTVWMDPPNGVQYSVNSDARVNIYADKSVLWTFQKVQGTTCVTGPASGTSTYITLSFNGQDADAQYLVTASYNGISKTVTVLLNVTTLQ
tara:strand:- start:7243 stop:7641 length:399 start_codon:yes stop_codon:yes gene_type:complete